MMASVRTVVASAAVPNAVAHAGGAAHIARAAAAAAAVGVGGNRGMATFKKKLKKRSAAKPYSSLLDIVDAPREWEKDYKSLARGKRAPKSTYCHANFCAAF